MLDCRDGLSGSQISSFNPAYQIHRNCDGTGDIEFDFWGSRKTWYYESFNNLDGCEVEFQVQACLDDEESFTSDRSLTLWGGNKVTDSSPLLPNDRHFNRNLSPRTRIRAIEEGRKELMEMIRNMPETSYELSLKDLVDQQHASSEEVVIKEKAVSEDKRLLIETEAQTKKQMKKKRKKRKACPITRTSSMDTDTFLIKMFFPSSLSFRKRSIAENSSKVSPSPSSEGSKKPLDKQWWIKRIFVWKNHKNRDHSSSHSSIDGSNSSKKGYDVESFLSACWLFFLFKERRTRQVRE